MAGRAAISEDGWHPASGTLRATGVTRAAPSGTDTLRFNLAVDGTDGPVWWDAAGLFAEEGGGDRDAGVDTGSDTGPDAGSDAGPGEAPPRHERIGGGSAYVEYLEHQGEPTFCDPSAGDEVVGQASVDALKVRSAGPTRATSCTSKGTSRSTWDSTPVSTSRPA